MDFKSSLLPGILIFAAACSSDTRYTLTANLGDGYNGKEIIMISRNKLDTIGQVTVSQGKAIFRDTITVPMLVQLVPLGTEDPFAEAIIEPGDIQVTDFL